MKNRWLSFLFIAFAAIADAKVEQVFHVAPVPRGSDQSAGTEDAPFATLDRARLAVREYRAATPLRGEIVVELGEGRYELASPVRFNAADSGEPGKTIIYRAAPGKRVILSGGRQVTGWRKEQNGIFTADVGEGVDFRQLWIGSHRAVRARTPNAGNSLKMPVEKRANGFDLPRDVLKSVVLRPNEVEVAVTVAWMHKRLRIARTESAEDPAFVRAVIAEPEWDGVTKQPQGDRVYTGRTYWLENAPEFLDAPGEFYLNRETGILGYRPRPGEVVEQSDVVRPELENLVILEGTFDAPVHDLRFEGISFAHTGWTRPNRSGFVDVQANSLVPVDLTGAVDSQYRHNQRKDRVPAAFQARTADRIVIHGCHFYQLGGTGVMFTGGGDDNVLEGNSFYDLAGGGIEFGEDAAAPVNERVFPRRNRISDNFIAHIGEDYWGSAAILGYYTDATEITRNEIAGIPYTAISQGWGWGNPAAPAASRNNRITHNRVNNYMRRLDDGGGIYTTDRLLGTEIGFNVVERMLTPDEQTKAGGALYLDQFTEGVKVHHNLLTETIRWLFIWNPNIRGNRVEKNYADTAALRNDGTDNVVEPATVFDPRVKPEKAREIENAARISSAFASAREFAPADDVIVDAASLDIHRHGEWKMVDASGSYAGGVAQSVSESASARVWPLLPKDGLYEVSVWKGGATGQFSVRHIGGETTLELNGGPKETITESQGWVSLGQFRFEAGSGAEITLSKSLDAPEQTLTLAAFRLHRVGN
ncbi:hypothetical protein CMV30_17245 [Nibricoccus aquaticus]|uniref:Uncharacterized protein n=1 Tax=Nibricoccus aquaticus TaxID=2576891 RepID=A0A290QA35_9BACT|nr:right-handed parallel beta-helix repeat-containing protein [Nibricoccus aquaticus]ATC65555.1 hypothetical protein CMV30_17245 [Nibricoccus aquaticus]